MKELKQNLAIKKTEHDKIKTSIQEMEDLHITRVPTSASLKKLEEFKQISQQIILLLEKYERAFQDAQTNIETLNKESDE